MIHYIAILVVILLLTHKWPIWRWFATRSGAQLILLIVVITFAVLGVVKMAGY